MTTCNNPDCQCVHDQLTCICGREHVTILVLEEKIYLPFCGSDECSKMYNNVVNLMAIKRIQRFAALMNAQRCIMESLMTKLSDKEKEALLVEGRRSLIHLLSDKEKDELCSFCKQGTLDTAIVSGGGSVICLDCFKAAAAELRSMGLLPSF